MTPHGGGARAVESLTKVCEGISATDGSAARDGVVAATYSDAVAAARDGDAL